MSMLCSTLLYVSNKYFVLPNHNFIEFIISLQLINLNKQASSLAALLFIGFNQVLAADELAYQIVVT
jgi:hypothetical protein